MDKEKTIHLLIIHQFEEEAERILSILRNAQIAVRPSRCIDEDSLNNHIAHKKVDLILVQQLQEELPNNIVSQSVKRIGKDIPIIALLDSLNNDSISEAYEAGISHFCTGNIKEQIVSEITNVYNSLINRRMLRQLEVDINDAERRCASLLDSSKDAIAYIHDGMHVYTNTAYLEFFDYEDAEEMEVTPFLNLVAKEQVNTTKQLLREISQDKLPDNDINMKLKTDKGDIVEAVVTLDKARVDGEPCVQFLVQRPKANLEAEKELREMRDKDMLTGFFNRNYFSKDIRDKINDVKSGKSEGYSVIYFQLDDDRKLEKELGKGNLDLLIADIAPFIKETIGSQYDYIRYDDTVFIVLLKGEIEEASIKAQHIVKKIPDHLFSAGESTLNCSISASLTQIIEKTNSGNEIIKILGDEIGKAREVGLSQVSTFDPAEEEKKARAANKKWIDLITSGIKNDEFVLHYQPIISIHGDEIEHYDCLVRLMDGEKLIMPTDFINVAKRHGLILEIDQHVIKCAIKAIKKSNKDVALFVKMSTDILSDPTFPKWLATELKNSGISGSKLILEIPESELVSSSKKIKPVINAIKGLNCKFVIEKFGSGLNSFSLFKHYEVDFVKIDSTFMQNFAENQENQDKVKEIIDKAHSQNKMVICEFVEDAAAMSILWKYSVNYVQGNFIAPASESMSQGS